MAPLVSLKCAKPVSLVFIDAYSYINMYCETYISVIMTSANRRMATSLKLSLVSIVLLTCVHIGATQDDGESLYLNVTVIH